MASLNLHSGFGSHGKPYDAAGAICGLDAAVICVQEVWQPIRSESPDPASPGLASHQLVGAQPHALADPVAESSAKLGAELYRPTMTKWPSAARIGVANEPVPGELSIAILTMLPMISYEVLELGVAPRDSIPRLAQFATIQLPDGSPLRLVNTHLTYAGASPLQLRQVLKRLRADRGRAAPIPTIIVGDLNMPGFLAGRTPGFAAAVRGRTWPAERPLVQLDHVLVSRAIQRLDGVVLPPVGSDHLPVRARLQIRS